MGVSVERRKEGTMAEIFKNYPFVTDEEIETLLASKTFLELKHSELMNKSKFNFYQKSPFYPANSEEHKANLSMYDRLWRRSAEKAKELEGGEG